MSEVTLEQLLATAREWRKSTDPTDAHLVADALASGILELLGEAEPCGFSVPVARDGEVWADDITFGNKREARANAGAILHAADKLP